MAAVVDFDRVRYSYPILDLGRAVLSGALSEGVFRKDAAAAFAEGYRLVRKLPRGGLLRAIRYNWCIESFWWMRPGFETFSPAPARFAREMIWTASQWSELEDKLGDI